MMSRPWQADAFIANIMHHFIEKQNSPAKLITHCPNLQQIYEDLRKRSTEDVQLSKNVHSFAYAPQRYASESQALCRMILTIDAVVGLLVAVQELRRGTAEAAAALETLAFITTERMLQLALLGDAALEQYRIVAFLDKSDLDEAEIPRELDMFHEKLDRLFTKQQVLEIPGLTQLMLRKLAEPRSVMLTNGQAVNWGGANAVTPATLEQCLARMVAYSILSRRTGLAEFPDFEMMSNFRVFSLPQDGSDAQKKSSETALLLGQLAKTIGVHGPTLQMEYDDLRPVALKFARKEALANFFAWKKAIECTAKQRDSHPCGCLAAGPCPLCLLVFVLLECGAWLLHCEAVKECGVFAGRTRRPGRGLADLESGRPATSYRRAADTALPDCGKHLARHVPSGACQWCPEASRALGQRLVEKAWLRVEGLRFRA